MKEFLKRLPLPISGVMLALASAGNMMALWGESWRYVCGGTATVIMCLLLMKVVFDFPSIVQGLGNAVIASVLPTFSMGVMILSTYLVPFIGKTAVIPWIVGLCLHVILMVFYFIRFLSARVITNVYPSSFIAFVGILVAPVTVSYFGFLELGWVIFWFGFGCYVIALPVILYRMLVVGGIQDGVKPLSAIFAAPASLCLLAYLSAFSDVSTVFALILAFLALLSTVVVLGLLPSILMRAFFPSYAALGFPFVVSALAMGKTAAFMGPSRVGVVIRGIATFERFVAAAVLAYVVTRYVTFLFARTSRAESARSQ